MDKRISIKTIYLLLVISIGLIGLGIGSTYAVFTARAEIDSPIIINSNLTHDSEVLETIEIEVPAKEVITSTLNISNTSGSNLNYSIWFIDEGEVVFLDAVSSTGTLTNGGSTSVNLNILNKEDRDVTVNVGISSSPDSIVLGSDMKKIDEEKAYAVYSEDDNSLSFYRTSDIISIGNTYNNKSVTNVYTGFETSNYERSPEVPWYSIRENVKSVTVKDTTYSQNTAYWFTEFKNCTTLDLTKLYTTNVTKMNAMFCDAGYNVSDFELIGLDNWDTSSATDMTEMFSQAGYSATEWTIGNISNWDTSYVTSMNSMFFQAGFNASTWTIGNLSNWNTSNVINMSNMFDFAGYNSTTWSIGDLSTKEVTVGGKTYIAWDTSKVENMYRLFAEIGFNALTLDIGDVGTWNVSNVINMQQMFNYKRTSKSTVWNVGDLSNWNTSSVSNMQAMFTNCGGKDIDWSIGNLKNWDTSKVLSMGWMFAGAGSSSTNWTIGDISNWNVSKVSDMSGTFFQIGVSNANTFTFDISGWDTSKVTTTSHMFYNAKKLKTIYVSDKWNTNAVTDSSGMFGGCTSLVGGSGTTYNSSYIDKTYARIDGGTSSPGYLTLKSNS